MKKSISSERIQEIGKPLERAHEEFARIYPGPTGRRQPVHTVYGGAHLFKADTARRLGALAQHSLDEFAPDFVTFAHAAGLPGAQKLPDAADAAPSLERYLNLDPETFRKESRPAWLAHTIYHRVLDKLRREPVEDFRIDFEDGYGNRPDSEEDGHAEAVAIEIAEGKSAGTLPPFIGIRIKPFTEELRARSIRTTDIFLTTLVERTRGALPENFFITLPKITLPEEVAGLAALMTHLENSLRLTPGTLQMELMIETTQSIFNPRGESNLLALVAAAEGRCVAAHFGTYDYTAACSITAAHQHMMHPACDFAKHVMQVSLAGTGIWLSDGATNIMPVAPHRAAKNGPALSASEIAENRRAVHHAWRLHYQHVQHSLTNAYYQGWDLHPAQLPTRYAAVYAFFLEGLDAAAERLRNFVEKAALATLVGDVFDDAATGQGLLNYFLRAINCGAITAEETQSLTGISHDEIRLGSFLKILEARRARS
ncbi:MAG: DUF6986 family protein [Candidatus Acidiferrales bacterium]